MAFLGFAAFGVEGLVHASEGPSGVRAGEEGDLLPGLDGAGLDHAEVPARAAGADDAFGEVGDPPTTSEFPAGLAWMADFEDHVVDGVTVAQADGLFGLARDGQVLAEPTAAHLGEREFLSPQRVVVSGVREDRLVGAAVKPQVGLLVPLDIFRQNSDGAGDRLLVKTGQPALVQRVRGTIGAELGGGRDLDGEEVRHQGSFRRSAISGQPEEARFMWHRGECVSHVHGGTPRPGRGG